jgi:excisionase family DNA binding protein
MLVKEYILLYIEFMEGNLFSVNQVAILLKVHPLTIRRYIKEGKLKALKVAGNIRISQNALDNFSQELQPTLYSSQKPKVEKEQSKFNLDDPIFRLKGRGMSLKPI